MVVGGGGLGQNIASEMMLFQREHDNFILSTAVLMYIARVSNVLA